MAHRLSKQGAANRIMRWGAVTAAALAACAGLFWIVAVLLLTRQTGQLLILMSGMGIGAACGAFRARKRGGRMLLVIALTVLALAVVLHGPGGHTRTGNPLLPAYAGVSANESLINCIEVKKV